MNNRDKSISDTSSSNPEVTTRNLASIYFLDQNSLVYQHQGSRIVMLASKSYAQRPSSEYKTRGSSSSFHSRQASRNRGRNDRKKNIINKYGFSSDEFNTYEEFTKLLSNFEPQEMCDILSDVLKDAKNIYN